MLDTIYAYRADDDIRSVYVFRFPPTISAAAAAGYGIVNPDGTARPSYDVIKASIAKFDPGNPNRPAPHPRAPLIRRGQNHPDHAHPERPNRRSADRVRGGTEDPQLPRAARAHLPDALHRRPGRIRVLAVSAHRRQETIIRPS